MKYCNKCQVEKSLDLFGKDSRSKDLKRSICKECYNASMREFYSKNSESIKTRTLAYHFKHREAANSKRRANRLNNLEHSQKISALWHKNNKEKVSLIKANYRARNRQKIANLQIQRSNLAKLSDVTSSYLAELRKMPCTYCGEYFAGKMHVDHIVPIARGGLHVKDNLTSACAGCNLSKGAKLLSEWKK